MNTERNAAIVAGSCEGAGAGACNANVPQLRAANLESIGQLASSVAHDFNNLLMVIQGNLAILRRKVTEPVAELHLDAIHQAGEQATRLVRELLDFARGGECTLRSTLDLAEVVDGSLAAMRQLVGPNIMVQSRHWSGPAHVNICGVQLEAAIMNLAANARDAMPSGGVLEFATRVELNQVELSISDTGAGMPVEILARVFDPFFTTKAAGKGTGLGLAQVHNMVRNAGGSAQISSTVGLGTTIVLRLPHAEIERVRPHAKLEPQPQPQPGKGEGSRAAAANLLVLAT
jgi:signal transduction histidine kinase